MKYQISWIQLLVVVCEVAFPGDLAVDGAGERCACQ